MRVLRMYAGPRKIRDREQGSMGQRPQAGAGSGCSLPQLPGKFVSRKQGDLATRTFWYFVDILRELERESWLSAAG